VLACAGLAWAQQAANGPVVSERAATRFLEQATWGPTRASVGHVQQVGFEKWLEEQFALPASPYPEPVANAAGNYPMRQLQDAFFVNAVRGEDQLRQRVAWALYQIWVVSGVKVSQANQLAPYIRMLEEDAFSDYGAVLRDVTLSPAMGRYLDMVNNDKPNAALGRNANENYAREVLQLFTVGLWKLNADGTRKLDFHGEPIPTYGQDEIRAFARAFTGWTYAPAVGAAMKSHNPARWDAPMVAYEANHDREAKKLLDGRVLPAGQSAAEDYMGAMKSLFEHPNVAPFVCRNLIQHLVTGDPSPAYVERVSRVFDDNGQGSRGDLRAVVRAILLDEEARAADASEANPRFGHLREPVLLLTTVARALEATVADANGLTDVANALGQSPFVPATVFNYYAPGYTIQDGQLNAPEFQILSPSTAMLRADAMNSLVYGTVTGVKIDWTRWQAVSADSGALAEELDRWLYHGAMPATVKSEIVAAVVPVTGTLARAKQGFYLATATPHFQVEQ